MGQELPALDLELADPVALRKEELKPLDLHPRDYVIYAYNALARVVELLLEQREEAPQAGLRTSVTSRVSGANGQHVFRK
jgi:hypothetical protein